MKQALDRRCCELSRQIREFRFRMGLLVAFASTVVKLLKSKWIRARQMKSIALSN